MTSTADLRTRALRCAAAVEPELMTGPQAAAAVQDLALVEKAAATARMFLALRVAKTDAWRGQGHKTAADWLAAQMGVSVHEANRQLGTARKANGLGKTKKAMREGKLSPDQAGAIADAATADPTAEDDLLESAQRDTNKGLKEKAARTKAAATDDATRDRRIWRERSKRTWIDSDGAWNLRLRGPAADGARFEEAMRPFTETAFRTRRSDGVRDTFDNREYDAAMALCGIRPLRGTEPTAPANTAPANTAPANTAPANTAPAKSNTAPAKRAGGSNVKVIVRIDHTALTRGHTTAGETCEVAGLGPISVATAKDLMADAFLAAVVTKGRDVVSVAHLGRAPNVFQRTAIEAIGTACSNIVCNRTVNIQIDHRTPYAANPETRLDNLDPLCTGNAAATTSRPITTTNSSPAPAADASSLPPTPITPTTGTRSRQPPALHPGPTNPPSVDTPGTRCTRPHVGHTGASGRAEHRAREPGADRELTAMRFGRRDRSVGRSRGAARFEPRPLAGITCTLTADQIAAGLEHWVWIGLDGKEPLFVSHFGQVVLQGADGVWWLDPHLGDLRLVWPDEASVLAALATGAGQVEYLLADLAVEAADRGLPRGPGQIYEFMPPPIMGGPKDVAAVEVGDYVVAMSLMGQIMKQVRDLPDGTKVRFRITD